MSERNKPKLLPLLACGIRSHKFVLTQQLSPEAARLVCTRCRMIVVTHALLERYFRWSDDFHALYTRTGTEIIYTELEGGNNEPRPTEKPLPRLPKTPSHWDALQMLKNITGIKR